MATVREIEDAIRVADQAGRKADVVKLAAERERIMAAQPQATPDEPDYSKPPAQEPGLGGAIAAPVWGSSVPDVARVGVDAFSYGGADALAGGNQRQLTDEARQRLGYAALPVDFVGGLLSPNPMSKYKPVSKVGSTLWHGAQGGGQAALDAYGHGQSWDDVGKAALVGSGLSTAASTVAQPISKWLERRRNAKAQTYKTRDDLKAAKKDRYDTVEKSGAIYHRDDVRSLLAQVNNMGFTKGVDDKALALIKKMNRDFRGTGIAVDDVNSMRRIIREKMTTNRPEKVSGEKIVKQINQFTNLAPAEHAVTGAPMPHIQQAQKEANDLAARGFRLKEVEKAAPQKKGLWNIFGEYGEKPSVKRFGKIDEKIKEQGGAGYTPAEAERVDRLAGNKPQMRDIGEVARKISPMRNKLAAGAGIGFSILTGSPIPMAMTAAAETVSKMARGSTKTQVEELKALIRDPSGRGIAPDPAKVEEAKRILAKMVAAGYRADKAPSAGGPR